MVESAKKPQLYLLKTPCTSCGMAAGTAGAAGAGLAKAGDANTVGESAAGLAGVAGIVAVAAYDRNDGVASVTESPKFDCAPEFTATSSRPAKRTEIYFIASFPQTKECLIHFPYNFEG